MTKHSAQLDSTKILGWLQELPAIKTLVALEGSTRSGKSFAYAQDEFLYLYNNPGKVNRVFRRNSVTHDETTIVDWFEVIAQMAELGLATHREGQVIKVAGKRVRCGWNADKKQYRFSNGSVQAFSGTDDPLKLQGCKQHRARIEEVIEHTLEAYRQISYRTTERIGFTFNPSMSHHWIFIEVIDNENPEIKVHVAYLHSTFRDNPFLSEDQMRSIMVTEPTSANIAAGTVDRYHWDVYGLGKRGTLKGRIFTAQQVRKTTFWPEESACLAYGLGLDFGSVHPTALTDVRYHNGEMYASSVIHESGLISTPNIKDPDAPSIAGRMEAAKIGYDELVIADEAGKGYIQDLCIYGFKVAGFKKSTFPVLDGIKLMQKFIWNIWWEDIELQREFETYRWKELRDGTFIEEPIKRDDDGMDSIRYVVSARMAHLAPEGLLDIKRGGRRQGEVAISKSYDAV